MDKTDILIIGGGPAGIVTALTSRKNYPSKKITLIRKGNKSIVPCGIPYIFHSLKSVKEDLISDEILKINKINLIIDEAIKINPHNKIVLLKKGKKLNYEKLILATGSNSILIPIRGVHKKNVWCIKKDSKYLEKLHSSILKSKNIVIIGGGFIGVELADELSKIEKLNINIIEKLNHCLITSFDEEFAIIAEEKLKNKGVKIYTNTAVEEIGGTDKVKFVKLDNGKKIPADTIILSIGAVPNTDLAKKTGIKLGKYKGIKVDKYMETNIKDIFAVGDCAETKCLLTKKNIPVMLASTACYEARIAAANLYKKEKLFKNKGTLAVFSTFIDNQGIGIAGLNEKKARENGFDIVIGVSESPNHHPKALPNTQNIKVKLIFSKSSGKLLGGQVTGPESVGEIINLIALSIQKGTTIYDFDTMQIGTHPLLTPPPTNYPLIAAAHSALLKINKS